MNFLKSTWGLGILAIILNTAVATVLLLMEKDSFSPAPDPVMTAKAKAAAAKDWNFWSPEIQALIDDLNAEKEKLKMRQKGIIEIEARLQAERGELEKVRAEIKQLREEISTVLTEVQDSEMKNLKRLAQTYSALSPKGAVTVMSDMDDVTAVKILALMKPDVVGQIFEEMAKDKTPDEEGAKRAVILSEKLRLMKPTKK